MTAETNPQTGARLLDAGIVAGPFFIAVALVQAFTREGFDMVRHPASLLSLGDLGWIQIANFVVTGLLFIAGAIGLRGALSAATGRRWVPHLIMVLGAAMIAGGVFLPDPSLGFPPGTPAGIPDEMSWHSIMHGFAPPIGFLALVVALFILARRFGKAGEKAWMWTTIVVAAATEILAALPNFTADWEAGEFNFLPLWAGATLGFCYTSLVIVKVKREAET